VRFPRTVLLVAALAWIAAGILASRIKVETDILSLVPEHNRVVEAFKSTVERFGSVDILLAVVRLDSTEDSEGALAFADRLAGSLREWNLVNWVEYRLEDPTVAALPLLDRATLFMTPEELDDLLARVDAPDLHDEAERLRLQLMAPQSVVTKNLLRIDPMGLLPSILSRVRVGGIGARFDTDTGLIVDPKRTTLLMLVKPVEPAQEVAFDRVLAAGLPERVHLAEQRWREEGWEGAAPKVEFTGGYIIALDDTQLIISDLVVGAASSLVGVMLLFLLAFRRRAALLYAFFPLATGLALTFVFVDVALGRLNSATSAFAALLIGLGIDFIIVLYGRYVEERLGGAEHEQAVEVIGRSTGVSVLLGAVTTAATFYAFLVTDFRGLSELGLLTGTGILILVGTVFVVLPALLTLLKSRHGTGGRLYLHSFGSDLLCRSSLAHRGIALFVIIAITGLCALAATRLEFDDDIRNMRSADNQAVILQQEIIDSFGLRFSPMTIRIDGPTEAAVLTTAREMLPRLEALIDGENLAAVDTIAGLIPSVEAQDAVISRLEAHAFDPADFRRRFDDALRSVGLNPTPFSAGIDHLVAALTVRKPLSLADLEGTPLAHVTGRYLVHDAEGVSTAVFCYPPAGRWRRAAPPALAALVDEFPSAVLTGPNVVSAELRRIVWGDAARAALLGLVLVFLLLWADLGSPVRSLLALVPLGIGMIWMLGGMALLGVRVNLMNIFVLTMVIGIGVDYGLHLLHRWDESGGQVDAQAETAKAIAVAALTTVVGFGSLSLSHYPGLRSVGVAAILGAVSTAVLSITLLPVLLERHRKRGPGSPDQGAA